MKIKEFLITRYGPLLNTKPIKLGLFSLFYGENEAGKTLTIDALVKLLFGEKKYIKNFEHIERVNEFPQGGYVLLEDNKGREFKLPEKGSLKEVKKISPAECRNIFIIRDSDLSINDDDFYTNMADRLTGLKTEEIIKVKEELIDIGKITKKSGDIRNIKGEWLGEKIGKAKTLISKIKELRIEIKENNFDELEKELVKHKNKIEKIEKEIKRFDDVARRDKYEKGNKALKILKENLLRIIDLKIYSEQDKQLWRDSEKKLQALKKRKDELLSELKEYRESLEGIGKELNNKENEFKILKNRKNEIDTEVRPELKLYEGKRRKLAQQREKDKFFTILLIISVILLGLSLLGIVFNSTLFLWIITSLFLILVIVSAGFKYLIRNNKGKLRRRFEKINSALSKFELEAENVERVNSNIQRFEEEYNSKYDELQEIKRSKEILELRIRDLQDKEIPKNNEKINKVNDTIYNIKDSIGDNSLKDYSNKLDIRLKAEELVRKQEDILESHFDKKNNNLDENISFWEKEIDKLKKYKNRSKNLKYSEDIMIKLKEQQGELEENKDKINNKMEVIQKKLDEVEKQANGILRLEDEYLFCKTSTDLETILDLLRSFIYKYENNRDNVLKVMSIFEEIKKEEKEKISELFGKESFVSKYFSNITEGLYNEVIFNQEEEKIKVRDKNKKSLPLEKLSGGAYDQLYFSIRLALGQKLLKDEPGFFIMDDPFIKSDTDRLRYQIDILKKISDLGWQIIYFSAKDEVKDVLKEDLESGNIKYIELQDVFTPLEKTPN